MTTEIIIMDPTYFMSGRRSWYFCRINEREFLSGELFSILDDPSVRHTRRRDRF